MSGYKIFIPNWRPSTVNQLMNCHWAVASRMKKSDAGMLWRYCSYIPKAEKKRLIKIKIYLQGKQKEADPDAYWKSLLDGLVLNGLLVDDSSKWVELMPVEYEHHAITAGTEINLLDIDILSDARAAGIPNPHIIRPTGKQVIPEVSEA